MGVRGSLPQQVLVNIPYIFAQALLAVSPWWTGLAILFKNGFQNNWMHLNVRWGPRWLEWFIATPRYHHIHHSDHPAYYGANIAALFPIWDHLFGTYVDPESVPRQLAFGTNEKAPPGAWPSVCNQLLGFTFAAQLAYLQLQSGPPNKGDRHGQGHGS
jgi:sterol desaturase/sphingolipid hydroxylase (fatty acid hydroxylase superfamily)